MRTRRIAGGIAAASLGLLVLVHVSPRDGSEPTLPLTDLRTFANYSNMPEERVPIGGGRVGFGMTSEYRMTTPWAVAAPRLRKELTALGFASSRGSRPNRTEWDRHDLHVSVREIPRPRLGAPTYLLRLTRPGTNRERLTDLYYEWRYRFRNP